MQNRTRTTKCTKMEDARAERAKLFFVVKYANLRHSNEIQIHYLKTESVFTRTINLADEKGPKAEKKCFHSITSKKIRV